MLNRLFFNIILFVLVIISFSSNAQISFDRNSFKSASVDKMNFDYAVKAYLINNATNLSDTLFEWEVISLNQPNEWELQVCTDGECIADPPLNRTHPFILSIGDQEEFKIGWALFEQAGSGLVKVAVTSINYPENKDTVTLEIATLSNVRSVNNNTFIVKPNPISNYMSIDFSNNSSQNIILYDILGNKVQSENVFSGERINTSNLKKGVYILRIVGSSDFSKVIHKN